MTDTVTSDGSECSGRESDAASATRTATAMTPVTQAPRRTATQEQEGSLQRTAWLWAGGCNHLRAEAKEHRHWRPLARAGRRGFNHQTPNGAIVDGLSGERHHLHQSKSSSGGGGSCVRVRKSRASRKETPLDVACLGRTRRDLSIAAQ